MRTSNGSPTKLLDKQISQRTRAQVPHDARKPSPAQRRERMLQVLRQFRVLVRALRRHYTAVEAKAGLGGAQLWALAEIAAAGELNMGDLAKQMAIHPSTASNLARLLLARELVQRSR